MPKPTLENSKFFKELLKRYRGKFNSTIQTCKLSDLEAMWTTANRSSTAYPTGDPDVKVVMMESGQNSTPIDISSEVTNNQLVYFPATYGDHCVVKIGESYHEIKFPYDDGPIQFGGNSQTNTGTWGNVALDQTIQLRNKFSTGVGFSINPFTVKAYGGALVDFGSGITVNITSPAAATTINEGGEVDFTLTATGYTGSSSQYFDVQFVGTVEFDQSDFQSGSGPANFGTNWYIGSNGTVTKTARLKNDYSQNEGVEWFKMQLVDPNDSSIILAESPVVTVNDTSTATYSIAAAPGTISEGQPITFTVTTTGIPDGTNIYYRIKGTAGTGADLNLGSMTGWTGNITSGSATFTITPIQDFKLDDGENLYVELWTGPYGWDSLVATSNTVLVNEQPWTVSLTPDVTTAQESTSGVVHGVTFNFVTTGVPDMTVLRCTPTAVGTNSTFTSLDVYAEGGIWDTVDQVAYHDVTINNNAATLKLNVVRDGKTEGDEQYKLVCKTNTTGNLNTIVAESATITITDHSVVGMNKTGKTFGPIRVNRDQGTTANASDWYTICNLDQIPNNSKVALFIDTSGSMTMNTVQASYDLLTSKLTARGITYITVQNNNENWVSDFDVAL